MSEIVKVEPVISGIFYITWTIQLRCNYDCMYCGPLRHSVDAEMPSLEQLKSQWIQIFAKTKHRKLLYQIVFSGGEPVVNKDFLPFIDWLHENYSEYLYETGLITNGSASQDHYLKLFKNLNYITFSTHTEFMDVEKFFSTAKTLSRYSRTNNDKYFMVNIMHEPWAKNTVQDFITRCKRSGINYSETEHILMSRRTRDYPIFKIKEYD